MKKRIQSLVLALVLCLGLCAPAVPALAYDMGKVGEYNILSAGRVHTAAIDESGSLWTWGDNTYGKLGNGGDGNVKNASNVPFQTVPVKVMDNVATVTGGSDHTAAIDENGFLWMWGSNGSGQLGDGTTESANVPVKVMDNVAAVSCGSGHTAAIKTDGTLWTWGYNYYGQLGNGTTAQSLLPVKVMDKVAAVSCGDYHTAAIKTDGTLWTWGYNTYGELGNGGTKNSSTPAKVMEKVAAVSCGENHTAAVKTDGTLWTWGDNTYGELGNGGTKNSSTPAKVMEKVAAVNCGGHHTAAIDENGSLWMWGSNNSGELGNGSTTSSNVPVLVQYDVAAVSCGYSHTAAIKTDGTLWTWGYNWFGELGNGNTENSSTPKKLSRLAMPLGVRFILNGGFGTALVWLKDSQTTLDVPTNPTKKGCTFGGWYTDEALTKPYNFNNKVTEGFTLYAKWVPVSSTATKTGKSSQIITLNGNTITLDAYTLVAANGGDVTYVKLRDIAALLENTGAKFNVDWRNKAIYVSTKTAYTTKNGSELKAITGTDGSYKWNTAPVLFDGTTKALEGIVITDGKGGGHTFFKLRDLGTAIGFTVGWSADKGIYIETN